MAERVGTPQGMALEINKHLTLPPAAHEACLACQTNIERQIDQTTHLFQGTGQDSLPPEGATFVEGVSAQSHPAHAQANSQIENVQTAVKTKRQCWQRQRTVLIPRNIDQKWRALGKLEWALLQEIRSADEAVEASRLSQVCGHESDDWFMVDRVDCAPPGTSGSFESHFDLLSDKRDQNCAEADCSASPVVLEWYLRRCGDASIARERLAELEDSSWVGSIFRMPKIHSEIRRRIVWHASKSLAAWLTLSCASSLVEPAAAYPIEPGGYHHERPSSLEAGDQTGGSMPYLAIVVAAIVFDSLTARRWLPERHMTALIGSAVLGLLWAALRQSGEKAEYMLPTCGALWLASWIVLVGASARCLRRRMVFVTLAVFIGGGAPVLALSFLSGQDAPEANPTITLLFQTIDQAGLLMETAWTVAIFLVQQLCGW
ncbi:hypothetical protein LTR78_004083 [Recurvomyces mirabilis]|uniref:Uncharacterized protein n=1 Tax=Recurvomyces mirabilis TaxID=574656 RepID=A0AAE0WQA5_9PEZI|nr:hypothetical protein LTR78_004083 [Recurvomyces mirabilis]KAK5153744.1 hypothetical protein LTS14_007438 [Recurvomyces mirabilis]